MILDFEYMKKKQHMNRRDLLQISVLGITSVLSHMLMALEEDRPNPLH